MSIGNSLLSSIILDGDVNAFRVVDQERLRGTEITFYEFIRDHVATTGTLPHPDTVNAECEGFTPDLIENTSYYAQKVSDRFTVLAATDMVSEVNQLIAEGNYNDIRELVAERSSTILKTGRSEMVSASSLIDDIVARAEQNQLRPNTRRVHTGYEGFDNVTNGLMCEEGELLLVYARPKRGKTWIGITMAYHAWLQGSKVQIVSMEMNGREIMQRIAAVAAGINPDTFYEESMSDIALNRLREFAEVLRNDVNMVVNEGALNMDLQAITGEVARYQPDLLLIDGAYMVKTKNSGRQAIHEKMDELASGIKYMSGMAKCATIAVLQLNRDGSSVAKDLRNLYDDPIDIKNLAGGDAFTKYTDFAIGMDYVYGEGHEDKRRLRLTAQRRGGGDYHSIIHAQFSPPVFQDYCTVREFSDMLDADLEDLGGNMSNIIGL